MALDFDRYYSVSPEEMEALQEVVAAARELAGTPTSDDSGNAMGHHENGTGPRSRAGLKLTPALAALDAVLTSRNVRRARTVAPWLHEYLWGSTGGSSAWRPGELERVPISVFGNKRPKVTS